MAISRQRIEFTLRFILSTLTVMVTLLPNRYATTLLRIALNVFGN